MTEYPHTHITELTNGVFELSCFATPTTSFLYGYYHSLEQAAIVAENWCENQKYIVTYDVQYPQLQ